MKIDNILFTELCISGSGEKTKKTKRNESVDEGEDAVLVGGVAAEYQLDFRMGLSMQHRIERRMYRKCGLSQSTAATIFKSTKNGIL